MKDLRKAFEQRVGQKKQLDSYIEAATKRLADAEEELIACEKAQVIIQQVAQITQEELKYHISELVTFALAAVFDDPYEFEVEFVQKRNQIECDLWFVRDGNRIKPIDASGGGAVDVASFALRVCLWSLRNNKTRNTLILDEPLRFLKGGDLPEKGMRMMKEISDKLNIQMLLISHIPDQIESADKVFNLKLKNGVSRVINA